MGLDPALEGCEEPFEEAGRLLAVNPRVLCAEKGDDWGQHKFKFFGRPPAAQPDWAEALKALRGFIKPFLQVVNPLLVGLVGKRRDEDCRQSTPAADATYPPTEGCPRSGCPRYNGNNSFSSRTRLAERDCSLTTESVR